MFNFLQAGLLIPLETYVTSSWQILPIINIYDPVQKKKKKPVVVWHDNPTKEHSEVAAQMKYLKDKITVTSKIAQDQSCIYVTYIEILVVVTWNKLENLLQHNIWKISHNNHNGTLMICTVKPLQFIGFKMRGFTNKHWIDMRSTEIQLRLSNCIQPK